MRGTLKAAAAAALAIGLTAASSPAFAAGSYTIPNGKINVSPIYIYN